MTGAVLTGAGYVEATVIPQGARNIRVEEVAEASNFLALRNEEGEYYLNGHWFIQWSGDYEMAGTVVRYDRQGNKESFQAQGPLKEPLHIMVLLCLSLLLGWLDVLWIYVCRCFVVVRCCCCYDVILLNKCLCYPCAS